MSYIRFKPIKATELEIDDIDILNGQLLFATDTKSIFLDISDDERVAISDIQKITEWDRVNAKNLDGNTFYYIQDNHVLYFLDNNGSWYLLTSDPTIDEPKVKEIVSEVLSDYYDKLEVNEIILNLIGETDIKIEAVRDEIEHYSAGKGIKIDENKNINADNISLVDILPSVASAENDDIFILRSTINRIFESNGLPEEFQTPEEYMNWKNNGGKAIILKMENQSFPFYLFTGIEANATNTEYAVTSNNGTGALYFYNSYTMTWEYQRSTADIQPGETLVLISTDSESYDIWETSALVDTHYDRTIERDIGLVWLEGNTIYDKSETVTMYFDSSDNFFNIYDLDETIGYSYKSYIFEDGEFIDFTGSSSGGSSGDIDALVARINQVQTNLDLFKGEAANTYALKSIYGDTTISLNRTTETTVGTQSISYGNNNEASSTNSIALGSGNASTGIMSFTEGSGNTASGVYSIAMGNGNIVSSVSADAIGSGNTVSSSNGVALGVNNIVSNGDDSLAFGYNNTVSGSNLSSGIGYQNTITSNSSNSFLIGKNNTTDSSSTYILGTSNIVNNKNSTNNYIIGSSNNATRSNYSTIIGFENLVHSEKTSNYSVIFGSDNSFSGNYSFIIGKSNTTIDANYSIALGQNNTISRYDGIGIGSTNNIDGQYSSGIGYHNIVSGDNSEAIGNDNTINGVRSSSIGSYNLVSSDNSVANGTNLLVSSDYSVVQGKFNVEDNSDQYLYILGNGSSTNSRSNALTIDFSGNAIYSGDVTATVSNVTHTLSGKQNTLVAGENITIDPVTNTISVSGSGYALTNNEKLAYGEQASNVTIGNNDLTVTSYGNYNEYLEYDSVGKEFVVKKAFYGLIVAWVLNYQASNVTPAEGRLIVNNKVKLIYSSLTDDLNSVGGDWISISLAVGDRIAVNTPNASGYSAQRIKIFRIISDNLKKSLQAYEFNNDDSTSFPSI